MKFTMKPMSAQEMLDQNVDKNIYPMINNDKVMKRVAVVMIVLGAVYMYGTIEPVIAEKYNCSSFQSQAEAQAHYSPALDRDHDGKACNGHYYKKLR